MRQLGLRLSWILLGIPFFLHCAYFEGIPVIGITSNGMASQVFVPKQDYSKRLLATVSSVQESALLSLDYRNFPSTSPAPSNSSWSLRTLVLGIGVSSTIGIGPFSVGALPKFRIMFTNHSDPTLP